MSKEKYASEADLEKKQSNAEDAKSDQKADTKADDLKKEKNSEKKIEEKLVKIQEENKNLEDKFLRSQAEMQNMQIRYNNERAQLIKYESQSLAKDVLPSMDNLERALKTEVDDEASKQLKKGVQMTLDALVKAMKDHGISEIDAEGAQFDPNLHQAVQTVDAENEEQKDHVVQVLQKGYLYKDRTLRPAMVVVAQ